MSSRMSCREIGFGELVARDLIEQVETLRTLNIHIYRLWCGECDGHRFEAFECAGRFGVVMNGYAAWIDARSVEEAVMVVWDGEVHEEAHDE